MTPGPRQVSSHVPIQPRMSRSFDSHKLNPEAPEFTSTPVKPVDHHAQHDLNLQRSATLQMAREFRKPVVEIEKFCGDPTRFTQFCRQFNTRIVNNCESYDECLNYLVQFTAGEANKVVQGYAHLQADIGFNAAMKELERRYGDPQFIAHSYITKALNWDLVKPDDPQSLDEFGIFLRECHYAIQSQEALGILEYSENLRKLVGKLPIYLHDKWRTAAFNAKEKGETVTFERLVDFVQAEARKVMDPVYGKGALRPRPTPKPRASTSRTVMNLSNSNSVNKTVCQLCRKAGHRIHKCKRFQEMKTKEREESVKKLRLCFNCLGDSHIRKDCSSETRCKVDNCGRNHHTLLHRHHEEEKPSDHQEEEKPSAQETVIHNSNSGECNNKACYFQLVPVLVSANGRTLRTVALLDSGSQMTVMHQSLADELGLKGKQKDLKLNTMNSSTLMEAYAVSFKVKPQYTHDLNQNAICISGAYALNVKSFKCATQTIHPEWKYCHELGIPDRIEPKEVRLLIGADNPDAHIQLEVKRGLPDQPLAVRTKLGWALMGIGSQDENDNVANYNLCVEEAPQMDDFWSTEAFGVSHNFSKPTSTEDRKAQLLLERDTVYENGRYQVPMLWRDPDSTLPNNLSTAQRRYDLLMKRCNQDHTFSQLYQDTLTNYVDEGFARKLTPEEAETTTPRTWYLPHHGVVNPNKPGKVRVVFDAAARYRGQSLNSKLMSGPDLLNSLFGVLQRFRLYEVALVTDIRAMYHQVRVPSGDADSLRFLFKEDWTKPGPPDTYQMLSHIFGATDSPACALYALQRTARDNASDFSSETVKVILHDTYMDDVVTSVATVSSTITLAKEVAQLLSKGGFKAHKWLSNDKKVLTALDGFELDVQDVSFDTTDQMVQRTLGIRWDVQHDNFVFICQPKANPATKRGLVSALSSVFDPCGFISPFTIRAKLLAQQLWLEHIEWDQALPDLIAAKWQAWLNDLDGLSAFKLPRHHSKHSRCVHDVELHVFSDASELAFATVAYLRYHAGDQVVSSFLASKSRVAPLKTLSIPRLELQGALLAARLGKTLEDELNLNISRKVFWTDSEIVLKYLQNGAKRFKPFVANRVAEILELTEQEQWRHVATHQNPADCCTRGLSANMLTPDSLWYQGPSFLKNDDREWPNFAFSTSSELDPDDKEVKSNLCKFVHNTSVENGTSTDQGQSILAGKHMAQYNLSSFIDPKSYSSLGPLLKRTAWLLRAIRNFAAAVPRLGHKSRREVDITSDEYEDAKMHWIRVAQHDSYSAELRSLKNSKPLPSKSNLYSLTPFYDGINGCLRVGGRLSKAPVPTDSKFQVILPFDHQVTKLIVDDMHRRQWHIGQEHLIAELRTQYWPVKARLVAKGAVKRCFLCYLRKVKPKIPRMADLPLSRLDVEPGVFYYCGVDYWGPMFVKVRRSTVKRWGCLFTCLTTRAVHLELADSLESDDFILCLRAFIGRRGHPHEMYSDNGTNFHGAQSELTRCLTELDKSKIYGLLSPLKIRWHFNPPSAPHFGGAWERLVKSVKRALNTTLGNTLVTDSTLRTALIEVEGVLNGRPLTHNSPDPNDFTALTPNHFILGRADSKLPPVACEDREINSRRRWRQCQVLTDRACRRWRKEYLPNLTARDRWTSDSKSAAIGSLVLILDDDQPRGHWELGRILATYPGDDGRVRAVDVKTATTMLRRPVSKIGILEDDV